MNRDYFINLSFAVYKVTELFPEKEQLRFEIRRKANDVLSNLLVFQNNKDLGMEAEQSAKMVVEDIKYLKDYFDLAVVECRVNPCNFALLQKEYNKISHYIESEIKDKKSGFLGFEAEDPRDKAMSGRQKKILDIVKEKQNIRISEIQDFFPGVSKRTIQRDLAYLVSNNLINRKGDFSQMFYQI